MRYVLWVSVVAGSLAIAGIGFALHVPAVVVVFVTSTANVLVVFALERAFPRRRPLSVFRDPQTPNDVAHGVLVAALSRTLAGPLAIVTLTAIGNAGGWRLRDVWWPQSWPLAAQVLLGLGVFSAVGYWTHRWCHTVGRLWNFHVLHHDSTEMQVIKANRIHVGEDVARQWAVLVPLSFLGVPGHVLLWMALWNNVEGSIAHSDVDCRFPSFAHWILPTPQNHLLHHAVDRELQGANFAGVTPLWDVLFGTYRHPERYPVSAYGVDDSPVPRELVPQLLYPFAPARARLRSTADR